jgi:hypothetical protein
LQGAKNFFARVQAIKVFRLAVWPQIKSFLPLARLSRLVKSTHVQSEIVLLTSLLNLARGKKLFICGHTASLKTFIGRYVDLARVQAIKVFRLAVWPQIKSFLPLARLSTLTRTIRDCTFNKPTQSCKGQKTFYLWPYGQSKNLAVWPQIKSFLPLARLSRLVKSTISDCTCERFNTFLFVAIRPV